MAYAYDLVVYKAAFFHCIYKFAIPKHMPHAICKGAVTGCIRN